MRLFTMDERFEALVDVAQDIPGQTGNGLVNLLRSERDRIIVAPASRKAHQAWPGGYIGHVHDMILLAHAIYGAISMQNRPLSFLLTDADAAILLHDIEKPWKYDSANIIALNTKQEREVFREHIIGKYEIQPSKDVWNAIKYAEGETTDYVPGKRKMGRLAAFVHSCDVMSARCFFDRPMP